MPETFQFSDFPPEKCIPKKEQTFKMADVGNIEAPYSTPTTARKL